MKLVCTYKVDDITIEYSKWIVFYAYCMQLYKQCWNNKLFPNIRFIPIETFIYKKLYMRHSLEPPLGSPAPELAPDPDPPLWQLALAR